MLPLMTVLITNFFFSRAAYLRCKITEWVAREATCNPNSNKLRPIHKSYFLYRKVLNILKSPSNHSLLPLPLVPKCPWTALITQHKCMLVRIMLDRIALEVCDGEWKPLQLSDLQQNGNCLISCGIPMNVLVKLEPFSLTEFRHIRALAVPKAQ